MGGVGTEIGGSNREGRRRGGGGEDMGETAKTKGHFRGHIEI